MVYFVLQPEAGLSEFVTFHDDGCHVSLAVYQICTKFVQISHGSTFVLDVRLMTSYE